MPALLADGVVEMGASVEDDEAWDQRAAGRVIENALHCRRTLPNVVSSDSVCRSLTRVLGLASILVHV
jgi:hypothetical protein